MTPGTPQAQAGAAGLHWTVPTEPTVVSQLGWNPEGSPVEVRYRGEVVAGHGHGQLAKAAVCAGEGHARGCAAGDVRAGSMRRVAPAVGEGAMSVYFVRRYTVTT
jgi:hypothetical protein